MLTAMSMRVSLNRFMELAARVAGPKDRWP